MLHGPLFLPGVLVYGHLRFTSVRNPTGRRLAPLPFTIRSNRIEEKSITCMFFLFLSCPRLERIAVLNLVFTLCSRAAGRLPAWWLAACLVGLSYECQRDKRVQSLNGRRGYTVLLLYTWAEQLALSPNMLISASDDSINSIGGGACSASTQACHRPMYASLNSPQLHIASRGNLESFPTCPPQQKRSQSSDGTTIYPNTMYIAQLPLHISFL